MLANLAEQLRLSKPSMHLRLWLIFLSENAFRAMGKKPLDLHVAKRKCKVTNSHNAPGTLVVMLRRFHLKNRETIPQGV